MTGRSMKFDPETWLRDDVEAEWALVRDHMQRTAPRAGHARETKRGIPASEQSGIDAVINAGVVSSERLPMLDVVFDRLARLMATSLRSLTSDTVAVSIETVGSVRFGAFLNDMPLPSLIGVARAREWGNGALVVVRPELAFSVVDVLLGGRRGAPPARVGGRSFTAIETKLVGRVIDAVLHDLGTAFEPLAVTFLRERIETNPRFTGIARPASTAVNARLRVEIDDRGGLLDLVIPHATLEPVREHLLQRFTGETFDRDSGWERHLASELRHARVEVEVMLGEQRMTLAEVMDFKPGQTLLFGTREADPVALRCGGRTVGHGRIGRCGNRVAVRVTDRETGPQPGKTFRLHGED